MSETPARVDWLGWSRTTFDRARRENRPILLALMAPWSEPCARMDRTTYASPEVVRLVGERFVPIRVNTDRRPDINDRYNLGGWPTTAFLTPDGVAFGGGTFVEAGRMPGVLDQVAEAFVHRRAEIDVLPAHGLAPREATHDLGRERAMREDEDPVEWLVGQLVERFDADDGGFGADAKFPHVPTLTLLLERHVDTGDPRLATMLVDSLDGLGRLFDAVEGGFFRYASRRDWTGAHTEKILQDNAQLVRLHLAAAEAFDRADYGERALRTIDWVRRTLATAPGAGFAASQAANTAYYAAAPSERPADGRPAVDAARYADANAEMIVALFDAARLTGDDSLRAVALDALEQVVLAGYRPGLGVSHVVAQGNPVPGLLADQVGLVEALLMAQTATDRLPYSMLAAELMEYATRTMWDETAGAFRDRATADADGDCGLLRQPMRPFALNCTAAQMLSRLAVVTGRSDHRDRAERILETLAGAYRDDPLLGACYGLAVREVRGGRPPRGWSLEPVDWHLSTEDHHDEEDPTS